MRNRFCLLKAKINILHFFIAIGDNARIEQAYMDGSGRKILIGERLFWPNGITIDYPTETLYWVDAKQHVIEAAHIDGTKRRKVSH